MKKPTFSIIIPTFNRANYLKRCLSSLVNQKYMNFEVIVCDDGSTDNTEEVVESFKNSLCIKYLWEENWGGPAKPRNNGIKEASGDWICFLDSDDWWYPEKLSICLNFLDKYDLIYHDLTIFKMEKKTISILRRSRQLFPPVFVDLMTRGNTIKTSSVVVKKKLLFEVGLFDCDRRLIAVEDFDLWLRISRITERFKYIPKYLGAYSITEQNITQSTQAQYERIFSLYQKHISAMNQREQIKAYAFMCYALGVVQRRRGYVKEAIELFQQSLRSIKLEVKLKSLIYLILLILKQKWSNKFRQ